MGVGGSVREHGGGMREQTAMDVHGAAQEWACPSVRAQRHGWVTSRAGQSDRARSQHFIRAALKAPPDNCESSTVTL